MPGEPCQPVGPRSANAQRGQRRTNEDKRRAVMRLLEDPEWSRWGDNEIARRCGVHQTTVMRIKAEIPSYALYKIDEPRLVTRNGTTYEMQTANIGGTAASASRGTQQAAELTPAEDFSKQISDAPVHNHGAQG